MKKNKSQLKKKILLFIIFNGVLLFYTAPSFSEQFPDIYKIICLNSIEGCSCYEDAAGKSKKFTVYHAQSVHGLASGTMKKILHENGICYYPAKNLYKMHYSKVLHSRFQNENHGLIPLDQFIVSDQKKLNVKDFQLRFIGNFWPTYYHLAMEDFHPGKKVDILTPGGEVIGKASVEFLDQVTWEGTGITDDGLRIRYGFKKRRYQLSDQEQWGMGAGYGYHIYPYRTVAVNYPGLCEMLEKWIPGCSREKAIGIMLYIKEVAERKVYINNERHDGYFCATDTGSPHFIKKDRMDIFVGTHGGGNPYLPAERQNNLLLDGGIQNLVPSDWRLWTDINTRIWCDPDKIPKDIHNPVKGECTSDYHHTARDKALTVMAVFDSKGNPVRCVKKLKISLQK